MLDDSEQTLDQTLDQDMDQTLDQDDLAGLGETIEQNPHELPANRRMIGKYELEKLLGKGGMGEVWKSHHPGLEIPVAIKILKPELVAQSEKFQNRFIQEGKLAASINHQNIIRVFDAGNDNGRFYLVMELVEGEDYHKIFKNSEAPLSYESVLKMLFATCDALGTAHKKGIVHRDIKPDNIMQTTDGEIKLADLGIAKFEDAEHQNTMEGTALGTPYYISPEQARDASKVDARSDIYSLGATIYHLLTGSHPFSANTAVNMLLKHINEPLEDPRLRNPDIPEELSAIICKMMAKDREERYQTIDELKGDLEKFKYGLFAKEASKEDVQEKPIVPVKKIKAPTKEKPLAAKKVKKSSKKTLFICLSLTALVLAGLLFSLPRGESGSSVSAANEIEDSSELKSSTLSEVSFQSLENLKFPNEMLLCDLGKISPGAFRDTGWVRSQNKNYIRLDKQQTLQPYSYIRHGSFLIKIRMHFSELGHTDTSFYLNEQEFCLSGKDRMFFSQGGQFGAKEILGSNAELIKGGGEKFDFTAYYKDGVLSYFVNDQLILQKPFVFSKIRKISLESKNTKVYVSRFELKGDLSWEEGFWENKTFQKDVNEKGGKYTLLEKGLGVAENYSNGGLWYNLRWKVLDDGKVSLRRLYRDTSDELIRLSVDPQSRKILGKYRNTYDYEYKEVETIKYDSDILGNNKHLFYYEDDFEKNFEPLKKGYSLKLHTKKQLVDEIRALDTKHHLRVKGEYEDFLLSFYFITGAEQNSFLFLRFPENGDFSKAPLRVKISNSPGFPTGTVPSYPPVAPEGHYKDKSLNFMQVKVVGRNIKVFLNSSLVVDRKFKDSVPKSGSIIFGGPGKGLFRLSKVSIVNLSNIDFPKGLWLSKNREYESFEIDPDGILKFRLEGEEKSLDSYAQKKPLFTTPLKKVSSKNFTFIDPKGKRQKITVINRDLFLLNGSQYFVKFSEVLP